MSLAMRKNTFKKKNRSQLGFVESLESWVNPAGQPGFCSSRSFMLPGPVQPLGRSDPGSTYRAGSGLTTMI
jgi:hypothetical protein